MIRVIGWIKAHRLKTSLCVVVLFALPLVIVHFLFKWHSGYDFLNAEWSAGDVLGYIAGFEAFVGTVALGALALWQNHTFRKENLHREQFAIRPYLFSDVQDEHIDFLAESQFEYLDIKVLDDQSAQIICTNRNKPSDVVDYIVAKQAFLDFIAQSESVKITQTARRIELLTNEVTTLCALNTKYVLCSYRIENHGAGSAVKIKLQINNQLAIPLFCLSHLEEKQLYLLINAEKLVSGKSSILDFSIKFYNIEDFGPYTQHETLSVTRTATGALTLTLDKQISEPVLDNKVVSTDDND